jgi:hypothetical protein
MADFSHWRDCAAECLRLSEESKDSNPVMASAMAGLAAVYSAAVADMEASEAKTTPKARRAFDIEARRATAKRLGIRRRITKCQALELSAPDDRTEKRLQTLIADLEKQLDEASA